jgi:hypothetical protein
MARPVLSAAERLALEWGVDFYRSEEARRAGWERHRERLLEECDDGWRPAAWWTYEAPRLGVLRPREREYEKATLWEAGLLYTEEAAALETRWREQFARAQAPDFQFCTGQDPKRNCAAWLNGDAARRAHYKWAGIPRALIKRWTSKRRSKAVQPAASPAPSP